MFVDHITAAVEAATYPQLHELNQKVWTAWSAGLLDDSQAQGLAAVIQSRKGGISPIGAVANSAPRTFLRARPRLRQRSPDRIRSIERRRRLAASGPMPPALAAHFTQGQMAVLRIVADEIRRHGSCSVYLDALAARAGVCRTTAQNAIRQARALHLITVQERRRRGQASLTNIITIISPEWRSWLRLTGFKKLSTTDNQDLESGLSRQRGGNIAFKTPAQATGRAVDSSNAAAPR